MFETYNATCATAGGAFWSYGFVFQCNDLPNAAIDGVAFCTDDAGCDETGAADYAVNYTNAASECVEKHEHRDSP